MMLKGKTAIITGGNDGIGRATAIRFVREGAKVAITARREEKGREVEKELISINDDKDCAFFIKGDVRIEEESRNVVEKAVKRFGRLDILVNCAAAQGTGTILEAGPEDYDHFFGTNIMGYGLFSKAAIPHLLKSEGSAIVNVSSLAGTIGTSNRTLYDISKAAVIQLTKCMACDYPTIRINCVSPGFTASEAMVERLTRMGRGIAGFEELAAKLGSGVLMNRIGTPDEIASVILFLASNDASYITGENIMVDGGALCWGNHNANLHKAVEELAGIMK